MTISPKLRFYILRRDNFRCIYCGVTGEESELQVDHIIPRANGGSDDEENLVTSCTPCNQGKGAKPISGITNSNQNQDVLVGLYCLMDSALPRKLESSKWQGHIIRGDGKRYAVQLFSWFTGTPTNIVVLTFEEMRQRRAEFFEDNEAFTEAGRTYCERVKYEREETKVLTEPLSIQRIPPNAGFPDWQVGKTIAEVAQLSQQMYAALQNPNDV